MLVRPPSQNGSPPCGLALLSYVPFTDSPLRSLEDGRTSVGKVLFTVPELYVPDAGSVAAAASRRP